MPYEQLYCLWHNRDGEEDGFCAGLGLPIKPGNASWIVGMFTVSGVYTPTGDWYEMVQSAFGGYEAHPMGNGRLGIACQMYVERDSRQYLKRLDLPRSMEALQNLRPLLAHPPRVRFRMSYLPDANLWVRYFREEERRAPPALSQLMQWLEDGECEATDGCVVEPDGTCTHGKKSWLLELGII